MGAHDDVRERLLRSRTEAESKLALLRNESQLTRPFVTSVMRHYVLQKYLLEGDALDTDEFDDLVELSLAKSSRIAPELVAELDTARSCDGATSAMVKKVLLFRSIENGLGIQLDAPWTAHVTDMEDFGRMVWSAMQHSDAWRPRLVEADDFEEVRR